MRIIDTHIHLGNIYGFSDPTAIEERNPQTTHPNKPNTYEQMGYKNIYLGGFNYLFRPLIVSSSKTMTGYGNIPNLIESMKTAGIEKSVILPIEPYNNSDFFLEAAKKYPNLIPFCSVHPNDPKKREKLKRYIKAGAKGLKFHPVIQEVRADDNATLELLEEVKNNYDIPVLFHVGWGSRGRGNYGFIENYKKVIENFKTIKLIFAHIGFYEPYPVLDAIEKHENIYCDISWQPPGVISQAIDRLGENRLMYGSDWPYNLQSTSINIILKLTSNNSVRRDKILYKNAVDLLGV